MRSLEELIADVKSTTSAVDLVSAIIYKSNEENIPKATSFFQQSFFQLKKSAPDLFENFIFDQSGIVPFSDKLDTVLFRLEASLILSTANPSYSSYNVTQSKEELKASYDKFDKSLLLEIDKCAAEFTELALVQTH